MLAIIIISSVYNLSMLGSITLELCLKYMGKQDQLCVEDSTRIGYLFLALQVDLCGRTKLMIAVPSGSIIMNSYVPYE